MRLLIVQHTKGAQIVEIESEMGMCRDRLDMINPGSTDAGNIRRADHTAVTVAPQRQLAKGFPLF